MTHPRTSQYRPDDEPSAPLPHPPAPTHRIVTPAGGALEVRAPREVAVRGGAVEWVTNLPFLNESPGSLRDAYAFARDGAYTVGDGWWRTANVWYVRVVCTLGRAICALLISALFTKLPRALAFLFIAPFAFMLANRIPVVEWIVLDWLDLTTWLQDDPAAPPSDGVG